MDWERFSNDELELRLGEIGAAESKLNAARLEILEILDTRQIATADGSRSLSEWVSGRCDLGLDTARTLVRTMRRTVNRPDLREALQEGVSLDRVEAVSRIQEDVGLLEHMDVAWVRREAAHRAELSADAEYRTEADRFLVLQPSLDESWFKIWGGVDGPSGAIIDKVLTESADALPAFPDGTRGDSSWRKATALVQLCVSDDPPPAQVTVFIDADQAVTSSGKSGVVLEAGPKVGRQALESLLCDAVTEITVRAEDGRYMEYGRKRRIVPPALARAILDRDGNRCAADGCDGRHRLQIHHIVPWSQGGTTDPDNLITLCWFHHQVVVHRWGYRITRHPDHGRIRFKPPERARTG
jgi:5-methylcytosine-specific restriction endonuclease McrA